VSLAKEFAKSNRVFFIEHPYSVKDVLMGYPPLAGVARSAGGGPSQTNQPTHLTIIKPPTVLPINFLPEGKIYNFFSSINNSILLKTLRKTIRDNNISEYIFINFFDTYFLRTIPNDIKPLRYIYQCMDDMSQVEYTSRHGLNLENEIISRADLVLCTSRELTKLKSAYSHKVHFHPNAADFELFNKAATENLARPNDLPPADKKIIGFTGSIEYRTDTELLQKIALAHPDKIIFMVGPLQLEAKAENELRQLPNIQFAGARHIGQLPAYLQYFDCCIIPYRMNTLTASIYPLKVNEYLAAGKPVVATAFSEDMLAFSDCVYLAREHEEFIRLIDEAINSDDAQKKALRIETAAENTWEKRVQEFWTLLT
jgi:glycosyltransferase involved in cell wall biosynthesis